MVLTVNPPLLKRHIQNIPLPYNLHKMRVQIPWHLTHIEVLVKPAADGYLPKASSLVLGFPSLLYADNQCHGRILKASLNRNKNRRLNTGLRDNYLEKRRVMWAGSSARRSPPIYAVSIAQPPWLKLSKRWPSLQPNGTKSTSASVVPGATTGRSGAYFLTIPPAP